MVHIKVSNEVKTALKDMSIKTECPVAVRFVCCIKNNQRMFYLEMRYEDGTRSMFQFSRHSDEGVLCAAQRALCRINSQMGWNVTLNTDVWTKDL